MDIEYARASGELWWYTGTEPLPRAQLPGEHEQRTARERAAGPPPRRDNIEEYGPRGDPYGDELFRTDRIKWYRSFTGGSIENLSLREQNEICDTIARRFRTYTDGRPTVISTHV